MSKTATIKLGLTKIITNDQWGKREWSLTSGDDTQFLVWGGRIWKLLTPSSTKNLY